jgi:hypothetical protein
MDAAGSRERDVGVFDYRMVCQSVDSGGKEVDKLNTAETSAANGVIGMRRMDMMGGGWR